MTLLDWIILAAYILLIIGMSWLVGRRQKSREDYYLGGRRMPAWQIALSVIATQVSAISLIGAPAYVALRGGGGLVWLQYEFAIPLAMMLIMLILIPLYHRTRGITIYQYLENRFGSETRLGISAVFLISRGLGSGVALLATGIVMQVCLDWTLAETVLLIGLVSIIYTTFGGIVADIYSDIIQLAILWAGSFVMIFILGSMLDQSAWQTLSIQSERMRVFDFSATGLGDGATYAFWPMLIGGLFLYLSYYGCDQSQAQRLLTTRTKAEAQKAMTLNGVLRFLLVLTYITIGVLLIPFLAAHPEFAGQMAGKRPDFVLPYFMIEYLPAGILGLLIAGFFAASMSSIDSALNSLSAASYQDFLIRIWPNLSDISETSQVRLSRILTVLWGAIATGFALLMIGGSETVLELVNKIGSAFYGPILAIFWLGMLTQKGNQTGAIFGLAAGVIFNIMLWQLFEQEISWLWWNVFGFIISMSTGYMISRFIRSSNLKIDTGLVFKYADFKEELENKRYYIILAVAFVGMLLISSLLEILF